MKKYIKPAVKAVDVKNETILAASDPSLNNAVGNQSWHSKSRNDELFFDDEEDF